VPSQLAHPARCACNRPSQSTREKNASCSKSYRIKYLRQIGLLAPQNGTPIALQRRGLWAGFSPRIGTRAERNALNTQKIGGPCCFCPFHYAHALQNHYLAGRKTSLPREFALPSTFPGRGQTSRVWGGYRSNRNRCFCPNKGRWSLANAPPLSYYESLRSARSPRLKSPRSTPRIKPTPEAGHTADPFSCRECNAVQEGHTSAVISTLVSIEEISVR
jgi:hypothetical protein